MLIESVPITLRRARLDRMTGNTMSAVRVALKAAARDQYIVAYIAGSVKFDVGKGLLLAEYTNWWICKPPNAEKMK